jgi:hypothetical protein
VEILPESEVHTAICYTENQGKRRRRKKTSSYKIGPEEDREDASLRISLTGFRVKSFCWREKGEHKAGSLHAESSLLYPEISFFLFSGRKFTMEIFLLQLIKSNLKKSFSSAKRIREG